MKLSKLGTTELPELEWGEEERTTKSIFIACFFFWKWWIFYSQNLLRILITNWKAKLKDKVKMTTLKPRVSANVYKNE